jgi:hypothetical protein
MKINKLQLLSLLGILGSLLMFSGDMLLYFAPVSGLEYDSIARMGTMPIGRLIAGGLMGPIASVFSIIGGYLFYMIFRSVNKIIAIILFISFAILFIFAGTYHALFPNFGFIGRLPESLQTQQLLFIKTYKESLYTVIFICGTFWTLLLFYLVFFKKTIYPKWMLLFTPTLLIMLSQPLKNYIPYPLGAIIYGGWINLCFMLFFIVCFLNYSRRKYFDHELLSEV